MKRGNFEHLSDRIGCAMDKKINLNATMHFLMPAQGAVEDTEDPDQVAPSNRWARQACDV